MMPCFCESTLIFDLFGHAIAVSSLLFSAITGMASIYALTPSNKRGNLGVLELRNSTKYWQGFVIEAILGFVVTFVFLSGSDPNRESSSGPALPYGSITVGAHLFAVWIFSSVNFKVHFDDL